MKTQKDSTFNKQIEVTKGKLLGEEHGMGEGEGNGMGEGGGGREGSRHELGQRMLRHTVLFD